jgi:hypothetical protein
MSECFSFSGAGFQVRSFGLMYAFEWMRKTLPLGRECLEAYATSVIESES